ncbi:MAG: AMP phosphorylase [Candidatus Diapherotrites archaeon]|nr:AMP phosphorylase [Candidatus Diapherotrites archaeon]
MDEPSHEMNSVATQYAQKMKAKVLDIESRTLISILHAQDCRELGVLPMERVELTSPKTKKSIVTVVDTTTSMVEPNEIGIFKDVQKELGVKDGDALMVSPSLQPQSVKFIKKKLRGLELAPEEITAIVNDIAKNRLSEIEASAFMTAVYIHGNTLPEIVAMTKALAMGGDHVDIQKKPVVDKHSIGGINGRVTMILVPIIAAAGAFIPKTASRSITSAAGTADAMEVLCDVELSVAQIKSITEKIGGVIAWGGGVSLAPGDDKIIQIEHPMALDPEGQVIASVMAKKFAVGAKFLVIDIPVGPDMKVDSRERAEALARRFVEVGKKLGMRMEVVLTDGTEPVGRAFGPALEAKVALETLEGKRFDNLGEKACELAGILLELCGKAPKKKGLVMAKNILKSGKAYQKMQEILHAQNARIFKSEQIKSAKLKETVLSDSDGEIASINVRRLVEIARLAGAPGDAQAGVMLLIDKGNSVTRGRPLMEIHSNNPQKMMLAKKLAQDASGIELHKVVLEKIE